MRFFLCVVGMVFIVEGVPYFLSPAKMRDFMAQMSDIPDDKLRIMGFLSMLLGMVIVFVGTR